jgi:hypothetical protein
MNVSQIYDGDGDPVEMKIELEKEAANWGGLLLLRWWRQSEPVRPLHCQLPIVRRLLQESWLKIIVRFGSRHVLKPHGMLKVLGNHLHENHTPALDQGIPPPRAAFPIRCISPSLMW